jgi:hypothetical protein
MVMGAMSIVGGFSLGDVSDELITWFDIYASVARYDYTDDEGE